MLPSTGSNQTACASLPMPYHVFQSYACSLEQLENMEKQKLLAAHSQLKIHSRPC